MDDVVDSSKPQSELSIEEMYTVKLRERKMNANKLYQDNRAERITNVSFEE